MAAGASLGAGQALGGAASCPGSCLDWPAVHRPRRPHLPACVPLHPPASGGGLVSLDGRQHTPSLQLSMSHVHFSLVGAAGHSPPRRGDHAGCLLSTATFGHSWSFRLPSHGAWARPARASAPGHELYVWAPPHAPSGVGQRFGVGTGAGGQPPASRSRVPPPYPASLSGSKGSSSEVADEQTQLGALDLVPGSMAGQGTDCSRRRRLSTHLCSVTGRRPLSHPPPSGVPRCAPWSASSSRPRGCSRQLADVFFPPLPPQSRLARCGDPEPRLPVLAPGSTVT